MKSFPLRDVAAMRELVTRLYAHLANRTVGIGRAAFLPDADECGEALVDTARFLTLLRRMDDVPTTYDVDDI